MEVSGPPTATVMNWPGLNLVAMAGATSVRAWYASTRRKVSTVPRIWTGAIASPTRRAAEQRGVLLQRPHTHLTADSGLDPVHRGGQAGDRGDTGDAAADGGGADLIAVQARPRLAGGGQRR